MTEDERLLQQLEEYKAMAKENKNIDVGALMANAMEKHQQNRIGNGLRRWGYTISLALPPFGLIFAIYFYLSGKDDGHHAAYMCIALTAFSIALAAIVFKIFLNTAGVSVDQFQQINPNDVRSLLQ